MSDINETPKRFGTTVTLIVCGTILFLAILGAFVYLEAIGKGTGAFMGFLAFAAAAIPGILNYKQNREIKNETQEIKEQTNGPLTAKFETMHGKFADLESKLNQVHHTQESYRHIMRQIRPEDIPAPRETTENGQ